MGVLRKAALIAWVTLSKKTTRRRESDWPLPALCRPA